MADLPAAPHPAIALQIQEHITHNWRALEGYLA
jgi:hypothetical protein